MVIDGPTELNSLKVPYEDLDALVVFTAKAAGFSGQPFMSAILEKVKAIRAKSDLPIEVDGGINDETILESFYAGATRLIATSYLFSMETPQEQYQLLEKKLQELTPQE